MGPDRELGDSAGTDKTGVPNEGCGHDRSAEEKEEAVRALSPNFDAFVREADQSGQRRAIRKVSSFIGDFSDALLHLRTPSTPTAHWVLTTGNRTAAGLTVPFDKICKDLVTSLGGEVDSDLAAPIAK